MRAEVELHARRASPIHAWDARWKLISLGLVGGVIATLDRPQAAAVGVGGGVLMLWLAALPWRLVLGRMGAAQALLLPCLVILPLSYGGETFSLGFLSLSREGLRVALLFYLRALALLTLGLALVYTTPMVVLLHALERFGAPRVLVEITLLAYRYLFTLWWEWTRMRWALATRGFTAQASLHSHRTLAQIVGVSLVRSVERTERIQQALRCRGFAGRLRTLHRFRTAPSDVLKAAVSAAAAGLLLALDLGRFRLVGGMQ